MNLNIEQLKSITLGAEYIDENENGFVFHRFSKKEEEVYADRTESMRLKTMAPANVTIECVTDAKAVDISVLTKTAGTRFYYTVDVYANGEFVGRLRNHKDEDYNSAYSARKFELGENSGRFELPEGEVALKIYMPWSVVTALEHLTLEGATYIKPIKRDKFMIIYGDSITQGYDAFYTPKSYAVRLAEALGAEAVNKAIGGERFIPALSAVKNARKPDYITVAYGTNDWSKSDLDVFTKDSEEFYKNLAENYPDTKIFAISPIWRADMDGVRPIGAFFDVHNHIKSIADKYDNITYIEGIDLVKHDKAVYVDSRLHPNDDGYDYYFDNLYAEIKKYI